MGEEEQVSKLLSGGIPATPDNLIAFAKNIERVTCVVKKTNGWSKLAEKDKITLEVDEVEINSGTKQFWSRSSEHLVIFVKLRKKMKISNNEDFIPAIVKFCIDDERKIKYMDQEHCNTILQNYSDTEKHLSNHGTNNSITVVRMCIAAMRIDGILYGKRDGANLWIEERVGNFSKFWKTNINVQGEQYPEDCRSRRKQMMVNTDVDDLFNLQLFIYNESGKTRTICDLQGGFDSNGKYILCDIEYTNTLSKLGWGDDDLLKSFENEVKAREKEQELLLERNKSEAGKAQELEKKQPEARKDQELKQKNLGAKKPVNGGSKSKGVSWQLKIKNLDSTLTTDNRTKTHSNVPPTAQPAYSIVTSGDDGCRKEPQQEEQQSDKSKTVTYYSKISCVAGCFSVLFWCWYAWRPMPLIWFAAQFAHIVAAYTISQMWLLEKTMFLLFHTITKKKYEDLLMLIVMWEVLLLFGLRFLVILICSVMLAIVYATCVSRRS